MKAQLYLGLVALLILPGCLDPIVGTRCAKGYSRCASKCVPIGTCAVGDAGADVFGDDAGVHDAVTKAGDSTDATMDGSFWEDAQEEGDAEVGTIPVDANGVGDDAGGPAIHDGRPEDTIADQEESGNEPGEDAPSPVTDADRVNAADDVPLSAPDALSDSATHLDIMALDDAASDISDDDALPDGDGPDGGVDAPSPEAGPALDDGGTDGSQEDGGAGWGDADAGDADGAEAGPLVCEEPLSICANECVDLANDPENCGSCANICTSGVCNEGECLVCASDETVCGRSCVNVASDPDNCGACGTPCSSGLCSNSTCEATGTGRVIVIGHDYSYSRPSKNRILGNAVFLWPINPVNLLLYATYATPAGINGADNAIAQVSNSTGRTVSKTYGTDDTVPTLLSTADVFLIYAQTGASDSILTQMGTDWASALSAFVGRGGILIVLDDDQAGNAGTAQIVKTAGLLDIERQSSASAAGTVCTVVARGDALATGLSRNYSCQAYSTTFTLVETGPSITSVVESVVGDAASAPVVISKVF